MFTKQVREAAAFFTAADACAAAGEWQQAGKPGSDASPSCEKDRPKHCPSVSFCIDAKNAEHVIQNDKHMRELYMNMIWMHTYIHTHIYI